MRHSREVIMKDLRHKMDDRLMNRRRKLPIFVLLLLILGIVFSPAESAAQVVPPRSQGLQIIRPLVPPPELPLEKEIRKNRQAIETNKRELEMQMIRERNIGHFSEQAARLRQQLACFVNRLPDCKVSGGKICGEPLPKGAENNPCDFCGRRVRELWRMIEDAEGHISALRGGIK